MITQNKRGAVNTYRFMALFILIGLVVSVVNMIKADDDRGNLGYNLESREKVEEIANEVGNIKERSDELVKASELDLSNSWGDEASYGRNWAEVFLDFAIPTRGFAGDDEDLGEPLKSVNLILIWIRIIITIFAGYEVFQIIIKPKVT